MNTYEKCKSIRNLTLLAASESICYKNWSADFKIDNLDITNTLKRWEEKSGVSYKINPSDLSLSEMKDLGFAAWEENNPMMLIPLWLFPHLLEDIETIDIGGETHVGLSAIDNDHRAGLIAYGVIPKN